MCAQWRQTWTALAYISRGAAGSEDIFARQRSKNNEGPMLIARNHSAGLGSVPSVTVG